MLNSVFLGDKKSKKGVSTSPKKPREIRQKTRFDLNRANPDRPEITLTLPPVSLPSHNFNPILGKILYDLWT